jgi:hypothetical protein
MRKLEPTFHTSWHRGANVKTTSLGDYPVSRPIRSRYPRGPVLRNIAELELDQACEERCQRVSTARVVFADYVLLQHDFPDLTAESLVRTNPPLRALNATQRTVAIRSIIDNWLIANAALVSSSQARQQAVNTPIYTNGEGLVAYRPSTYGRALIAPLNCPPLAVRSLIAPPSDGLLDLKGVGVAPSKIPTVQADGLYRLEYALRDYLVQRAVDLIFAREAPSLWTVPTYALLALGFRVTRQGRAVSEAGIHVRRAHARPRAASGDPTPHKVRLAIELLLRRYGLTSVSLMSLIEITRSVHRVLVNTPGRFPKPLGPLGVGLCLAILGSAAHVRLEATGVQTAGVLGWPLSGSMVDFGSVHARSRFTHPLALDERISLNVAWPDTPAFVQPDPQLAIPYATWRTSVLTHRCRRLVDGFVGGTISREALRGTVDAMLAELVHQWSCSPG